MRLIGVTLAAVMLSVIVLSAAGIYALMSFTVTRREDFQVRPSPAPLTCARLPGAGCWFRRRVAQLMPAESPS